MFSVNKTPEFKTIVAYTVFRKILSECLFDYKALDALEKDADDVKDYLGIIIPSG